MWLTTRWPLPAVLLCTIIETGSAAAQYPTFRADHENGWRAFYRGRYAESERRFQAALQAAEDLDDLELEAQALGDLAAICLAEEKYPEAERFSRRGLELATKIHGPRSPQVNYHLNTLARLAAAQRQYAEAERTVKRALKNWTVWEKIQRAESAGKAACLATLAELSADQGKYAEAEAAARQAQAIRTRLARAHPASEIEYPFLLARSLDTLGLIDQAQGRYSEAEPLFKRALALREQVLPNEHPDLVRNLDHYAALLWDMGRSQEAEKIAARAQALRAKQSHQYDREKESHEP